MRGRTLDGKDRIHALRQEVLQYRASQVTGVYALLQEVRNRTLTTKQAIARMVEAGKKRKYRREQEDAFAAALILQNYLDKLSLRER